MEEGIQGKGLKMNLGKTKVVVSGTEGEVSVSKVDPCGICGKQVMVNSVLCGRKWICCARKFFWLEIFCNQFKIFQPV